MGGSKQQQQRLFLGFLLLMCPFALASTKKLRADKRFPLSVGSESAKKYPDFELTWADNKTFRLSFAQLAFELGIPEEELELSAKGLADLIDSKTEVVHCQTPGETTHKYCQYFETVRKDIFQKSTVSVSTKERAARVTKKNASQMQRQKYPALLNSLTKITDANFVALLPSILKTKGCPKNLSAAAMRRAEMLLPEPKAKTAIVDLYKHADTCLKASDEAYEVIHFRYALLSYLWGNKEAALSAINKAVQARESDERARVLYWAGLMQSDLSLKELYWLRLTADFPLTYHALEVWEKKRMDPMRIFSSRPSFEIVRNALGSDAPVDSAMRWLEALYFIKRERAAVWLSDWISKNYFDQLSPSNVLYISKLKSKLNTPLSTIRFLSGGIRKDPTLLNDQTLRILFPRHYFESFSKSSAGVDAFLLLAVARQESGFNPMARSSANAKGLLQLLPQTARRLSSERNPDLYNPEKNIRLGAKFLSQLIDRYGSKVELALAAYNAGPNRIPQWQSRYETSDDLLFVDLIPFKETRNYVSSILRNNYWYERLYRVDPEIVGFNKGKRSSNVQRLISSHSTQSVDAR